MTRKLYEEDSYVKAFDAVVADCRACGDGYEVLLDQTAFFPEGGGQGCDRGQLAGQTVLEVYEEKGCVWHRIQAPLVSGSSVHGEIDWACRFDRMQQHSGEHILSGLVHNRLGYDNVGFHLGDDIVTMDFNGEIDQKTLLELEIEANKAVWDNRRIIVSYPDQNTLKSLNYRSKIEIEGQVRIVTVEGIDVCACCAPHVRLTGEVGQIKILSCQKYKGGVRMSIACGLRALKDCQMKQKQVSAISVMLSAKIDQVAEAVDKQQQELQKTKYALAGMKERVMLSQIESLQGQPGCVCLFVEDMESGPMRKALNVLTGQRSALCGIFSGDDQNGYKFLIGSASGQAKAALDQLKTQFVIRGGGSPMMVQGQISGMKVAIETVFMGLYAD